LQAAAQFGNKEISIVSMDMALPVMDSMTCERKIRGIEVKISINGNPSIIAVTETVCCDQMVNVQHSNTEWFST
jgi:hypothetical protein